MSNRYTVTRATELFGIRHDAGQSRTFSSRQLNHPQVLEAIRREIIVAIIPEVSVEPAPSVVEAPALVEVEVEAAEPEVVEDAEAEVVEEGPSTEDLVVNLHTEESLLALELKDLRALAASMNVAGSRRSTLIRRILEHDAPTGE